MFGVLFEKMMRVVEAKPRFHPGDYIILKPSVKVTNSATGKIYLKMF